MEPPYGASEASGTEESGSHSDEGSSSSSARAQLSLRKMCAHVHSKLVGDSSAPLSVKEHKSAVCMMEQIKDRLLQRQQQHRGPAARDVRTFLLYSGIAVRQRLVLETDDGDQIASLRTTLALLFVLQLLCDPENQDSDDVDYVDEPSGATSMEVSDARNEDDDGRRSADGSARPPPPPPPPEARMTASQKIIKAWMASSVAEQSSSISGWNVNTSDVCQACLRHGKRACDTLASAERMAQLFFDCSGDMLRFSLLEALQPGDSFLGLDCVGFMDAANAVGGTSSSVQKNLNSIVDLAESEAGQTALRDLILSFSLPVEVVGMRRVLVLSRESNQTATERHTELLQSAHEAAMRGAQWEWEHSESEVVRTCCMLSGLSMIFAGKSPDIRKDEAFGGRIELPFLSHQTLSPTMKRMVFLPHLNEWIVYSTGKRDFKPVVHMRATGVNGLGQCALMLVREHRTDTTFKLA